MIVICVILVEKHVHLQLDRSNHTWKMVQVMQFLVEWTHTSSCHVIIPWFPQYIVLKQLGLCSSFNVSDQVPWTYKTTDKIVVFYILIFKFFESRRRTKRFWTEW
jgi:hypothetical protein